MFDKQLQDMLYEIALDDKANNILSQDTPIIVGLIGGVAFISMLLIILMKNQPQGLSTTAAVSLIVLTVIMAIFFSWVLISLNKFFYFDYHRSQLS